CAGDLQRRREHQRGLHAIELRQAARRRERSQLLELASVVRRIDGGASRAWPRRREVLAPQLMAQVTQLGARVLPLEPPNEIQRHGVRLLAAQNARQQRASQRLQLSEILGTERSDGVFPI